MMASVCLLATAIGCSGGEDGGAQAGAAGNTFSVQRVLEGEALRIHGSCSGYDSQTFTSQARVQLSGGRVSWTIFKPIQPNGSWSVTIPIDDEVADTKLFVIADCASYDTSTGGGASLVYTLHEPTGPFPGVVPVDSTVATPANVAGSKAIQLRGPACKGTTDHDTTVVMNRVVAAPEPTGEFSPKYDPNELPWTFQATPHADPGGSWHATVLLTPDVPGGTYTLQTGCFDTALYDRRSIITR